MSAPISPALTSDSQAIVPPEFRPRVAQLVTEDDTPVDGIYSEKQMRLLTVPLFECWSKAIYPRTFVATANVGMFFSDEEPPIVPDTLLSLDVKTPDDLFLKKNRSYFFWRYGKAPEVVIEVVSNDEGGELGTKKAICARVGILYYVVWDPFLILSGQKLHCFVLAEKTYKTNGPWFPAVGLGLTEWTGAFEDSVDTWLRWCDQQGQVIPTPGEWAEQERQRADQETQRADQEKQRADRERQQAEEARLRAERLAAQLRALGIDPDKQ